jgi:hypothetical protein
MNAEPSTSMRPYEPWRYVLLLAASVVVVLALAHLSHDPSDQGARERGIRDAQQEIQRTYRENLSPAERGRLCVRDASAC